MLSYRKELDGLRALAVTAVIIYHANLKAFGLPVFQGGFFGVDIFFVLSGYLITGIVRNQMDNGTFSFRDFYWRRAKRIVPALVIMLLVTTGLAYLILLPDDLVTYAKSLQSALYFGSNHFFYGEDSYTAAASIYRPLLHTWSLSVEWQFYIIFPFIIWLSNKYFPKHLFSFLLSLALISFIFSCFVVRTDPDMAFYLLPTRAWELILGGLGTFYNKSRLNKENKEKYTSIIYLNLPMTGIILIIYSMLFIDHDVKHPSFITLLPVIGTCLFIIFSREGELSFNFLSLKPIVGLGMISYSLYLWHQPVFAFFRLINNDQIRPNQFISLSLVSILLAYLTFIFIESNYQKKIIDKFKILSLSCVIILCVSFSYLAIQNEGLPSRFGALLDVFHGLNDKKTHIINNVRCHSQRFENSCKIIKEKNILLLGDSHAGGLGKHIYTEIEEKNLGYLNLTPSGCIAIDTVITKTIKNGVVVENKDCAKESKKISEYIEDESSPRFTIVYMSRLPLYLNRTRFDNNLGGKELGLNYWVEGTDGENAMEAITKKLSLWASLGHNLILVYPVPEMGWNVSKLIQKKLGKYKLFSKKMEEEYKKIVISVPYEIYQERTKNAFSALDNVEGTNVSRVYPDKLFCTSTQCIANDTHHLYYYDDNHLSTHGAKIVVNEITKYFP